MKIGKEFHFTQQPRLPERLLLRFVLEDIPVVGLLSVEVLKLATPSYRPLCSEKATNTINNGRRCYV